MLLRWVPAGGEMNVEIQMEHPGLLNTKCNSVVSPGHMLPDRTDRNERNSLVTPLFW